MTADEMLILAARWLHILSACVAVGAPIFARLALMPAVETLDDDARVRLREAVAARWRIVIYLSIVIFLATGLFNFLGPHAHWRIFKERQESEKVFQYHLLFGIKFFLAFVMFFLSSALSGRSKGLAYFRHHARGWTTVLILVGLAVVALSAVLRFMA